MTMATAIETNRRVPRAFTRKIEKSIVIPGTNFEYSATIFVAEFDGAVSYHETSIQAEQALQGLINQWTLAANKPAARKNAKISCLMARAKIERKIKALKQHDPTCEAIETLQNAVKLLEEADRQLRD